MYRKQQVLMNVGALWRRGAAGGVRGQGVHGHEGPQHWCVRRAVRTAGKPSAISAERTLPICSNAVCNVYATEQALFEISIPWELN